MGVLVTIVSCISIVFFFFNKTVALALATFSLIFGIIEIIRRIVKKSSVILPLFSILMSLIPIILIIVSLFVPSVAKIGMKTSTTVDKYQTPYYGSWYNDETKTTVTFNKDKSYLKNMILKYKYLWMVKKIFMIYIVKPWIIKVHMILLLRIWKN